MGTTGLGLGLALMAGRLAQVLSRRHKDRSGLPVARWALVLLLAWAVAAAALVFYHSGWYLASIVGATGCFYGAVIKNPVEEDEELLLEKEHRKFLARSEGLTALYEQLLSHRQGTAFMDEALLPASRARLARALRLVYWTRLTGLNAGLSRAELIKRYTALTCFIKGEDAAFMNEFISQVHNSEDTVRFARQDPEYFILARERMNKVYQRVSEEHNQLMNEWYQAGAAFDED